MIEFVQNLNSIMITPLFASARLNIKRLAGHPATILSTSFAFFLSTFAIFDCNREITENETLAFRKRASNHLGESLEQLHSSAFRETMTFDNIKANRFRCVELYFLFQRAQMKKEELQKDEMFNDRPIADIEAIVATEFYGFGQRMCRQAMIRNFHVIKWFKAVMQDAFIKFYILPVAGFFGARYFKLFDQKNRKAT